MSDRAGIPQPMKEAAVSAPHPEPSGLGQPRSIVAYATFEQARQAEEYLVRQGLSRAKLMIVGTDLYLAQRRMSGAVWRRVAFGGVLVGLVWGAGLALVLWYLVPGLSLLQVIVAALGFGVVYGIVSGFVTFGLTHGDRDIDGVLHPLAAQYAIEGEVEIAGRAREMIAHMPPPRRRSSGPPATAPVPVAVVASRSAEQIPRADDRAAGARGSSEADAIERSLVETMGDRVRPLGLDTKAVAGWSPRPETAGAPAAGPARSGETAGLTGAKATKGWRLHRGTKAPAESLAAARSHPGAARRGGDDSDLTEPEMETTAARRYNLDL